MGDFIGTGENRRSESDQQHVYVGFAEKNLEHGPVLLRRGRGDQVDRIADRGAARDDIEEPSLRLGGKLGHLETLALAGVRGENPATSRVADDRHPPAGRKRLVHEEVRDVEQLLERLDANDTGLPEQGVDGLVRDRADTVGMGAPLTGHGAGALDRDDRRLVGDTAGDAAELPRVPERLQIEQDHVRLRILRPETQQVVAAHVGLVAEGDEARDPEPTARQLA